jgi:hypothetical protein
MEAIGDEPAVPPLEVGVEPAGVAAVVAVVGAVEGDELVHPASQRLAAASAVSNQK